MKKRAQHSSVSDMVRNISDDRAFAEDFTKHLLGRQLIKTLTVLRTREGLSQQELAGRLGCTQSKISKLESSNDADLRFGELLDYAGAVEHEMRLFLVPKGQTVAEEVKMHAVAVKRLLQRLVQLAGKDKAMARGVEQFLVEAAFNLGRFVESAAAELPPLAEESPYPLHVEAPDEAPELPLPRR